MEYLFDFEKLDMMAEEGIQTIIDRWYDKLSDIVVVQTVDSCINDIGDYEQSIKYEILEDKNMIKIDKIKCTHRDENGKLKILRNIKDNINMCTICNEIIKTIPLENMVKEVGKESSISILKETLITMDPKITHDKAKEIRDKSIRISDLRNMILSKYTQLYAKNYEVTDFSNLQIKDMARASKEKDIDGEVGESISNSILQLNQSKNLNGDNSCIIDSNIFRNKIQLDHKNTVEEFNHDITEKDNVVNTSLNFKSLIESINKKIKEMVKLGIKNYDIVANIFNTTDFDDEMLVDIMIREAILEPVLIKYEEVTLIKEYYGKFLDEYTVSDIYGVRDTVYRLNRAEYSTTQIFEFVSVVHNIENMDLVKSILLNENTFILNEMTDLMINKYGRVIVDYILELSDSGTLSEKNLNKIKIKNSVAINELKKYFKLVVKNKNLKSDNESISENDNINANINKIEDSEFNEFKEKTSLDAIKLLDDHIFQLNITDIEINKSLMIELYDLVEELYEDYPMHTIYTKVIDKFGIITPAMNFVISNYISNVQPQQNISTNEPTSEFKIIIREVYSRVKEMLDLDMRISEIISEILTTTDFKDSILLDLMFIHKTIYIPSAEFNPIQLICYKTFNFDTDTIERIFYVVTTMLHFKYTESAIENFVSVIFETDKLDLVKEIIKDGKSK